MAVEELVLEADQMRATDPTVDPRTISPAQQNLDKTGTAEADAHCPPQLPEGDKGAVTQRKEEHRREHAAFLSRASGLGFIETAKLLGDTRHQVCY